MGNIFRKKTKIVPIVLIKGSAVYTYDCSICLKSFNNNNYEMPCGHNFHQECILIWFDKKMSCVKHNANQTTDSCNKSLGFDREVHLQKSQHQTFRCWDLHNITLDNHSDLILQKTTASTCNKVSIMIKSKN